MVGADGLGNPRANALPHCQLRQIQSLANLLLQPDSEQGLGLWWCDVLCVPVSDENIEYRKSAIRNMRTTYQKASKVLALDRELANRSKDSCIIEPYIRLKLSGWTRRLRTVQEGMLAMEVHIQFADGARTLQEIDAAMQQKSDQPLQGLYLRYRFLAKTFFGPYIRGPTQQGHQRIMGLWKAVQ